MASEFSRQGDVDYPRDERDLYPGKRRPGPEGGPKLRRDPWADLPAVQRARLRAHARSLLQEMGESEAELATRGISLEAAGCIVRPHEMLPYEIEEAKALGKKLAREHGW